MEHGTQPNMQHAAHAPQHTLRNAQYEPSYLALHRSGELARRARAAMDTLRRCCLCPRYCAVDRLDGGRGACGIGSRPVIASWNVHRTSGYETVETLRLLEGMIDIWLPDAKYTDDAVARRLSGFAGYVAANRATLKEIYRQVGEALLLDDDGIARRGMIIRHLVLPEGLADTAGVLRWIATELSPRVHVSIMDQYFLAYKALNDPVLGRKITPQEYEAALDAFEAAGLSNGWMQEHEACAPDEDA